MGKKSIVLPPAPKEPEVAPKKGSRSRAAKLGTAPSEVPEALKQKVVIGYIDKVHAVLVREPYQNPVTGAMYERFHLVDGSTQVLAPHEVNEHFKSV